MIDKTVYADIGGKQYPIPFNLNVIEQVAEHFGGLEKLPAIFLGGSKNMKHEKWLLTVMVNEGIDILNDDGKNRPFFSEKQIGRLIRTPGEWRAVEAQMSVAISASLPEDDGGPKNEAPTQTA